MFPQTEGVVPCTNRALYGSVLNVASKEKIFFPESYSDLNKHGGK